MSKYGTSVRMFKKSLKLLQERDPDVVLTHRGERILEQAKQPYVKKPNPRTIHNWVKAVNKARREQA